MGHPPPFLLRAGSGEDHSVGYYAEGPRNKTLGWFDDPGLKDASDHLEPGDRLIFYTDGFLEAKNAEGEVYGEDRLAETIVSCGGLPAESLADELINDVETFSAGKLEDDLTMIIVEFQGAALDGEGPRRLTGEEPWHSRR
jgi:serine phosphatase RsbU (regulator of sigma subunit)